MGQAGTSEQSVAPRRGRLRRGVRFTALALIAYALISILIRAVLPAPPSVGIAGPWRPLEQARWLVDDSWIDTEGQRQLQQSIFDHQLDMIEQAHSFVLLDLFLFNEWQGDVRETTRALSSELVDALLARRAREPDFEIFLITDPINEVYGSLPANSLQRLRKAGVDIHVSCLTRLQDSNPTWSGLWRTVIRPLGNEPGTMLPNPFGEGRVSLRSWLSMLNFKANHRKLIVADNAAGGLEALVSSANPHDGSSAHRNVALWFDGAAARDLLDSERAWMQSCEWSGALARLDALLSVQAAAELATEQALASPEQAAIRVLGESTIREAALESINSTGAGDQILMAMFYLAERDIIEALQAAWQRGAGVRVLLDVNRDAFGRVKNGVPNRPVAAELVAGNIEVRWCATQGEQCHAKWLHVVREGQSSDSLIGSANFTRRNLNDLNLETDVQLRLPAGHPLAQQQVDWFMRQWNNADGRRYSDEYAAHGENSPLKLMQYRVQEFSGLATF